MAAIELLEIIVNLQMHHVLQNIGALLITLYVQFFAPISIAF